MARLILPVRFADKCQLQADVKAKDTADGAASIIRPTMTDASINLATDATSVTNAKAKDVIFKKNEKDAEKRTKERNLLIDPAFKDHTLCAQFLKRRFVTNITILGDYGITLNGNRIVYPVDFVGKQEAMLLFIDHHLSFAVGTSPLEGFITDNDIDLVVNRANAVDALTKHNERNAMNNTKETARVDRDNLINPVMDHLTIIGNFIVGYFPKNPNKAGDWSYTVDTSPQGTKIKSGTINFSSSKTLLKLAIGGVLTNTCEHNLNAFKGKTTSGTPIVLVPGQNLVITQGFGTITLQNPSNTAKGSYQGVFNP